MNQLKSSQILINKEKFIQINSKISSVFQDYYNLIETYSYEINYIENSINSFHPIKKFNIKNFIEKQQLLIKDLVNIINNMLLSIKLHSSKTKNNSKNKKSIKSIIENNNTNINYIKNKNKSFDNNNKKIIYKKNKNINDNKISNNINKNSFSITNFKNKKKETNLNQYINKPKIKEREKENINNNINEISSKSSSITNKKSFINNSNSFLSDLNNITNINAIYKNYNNNQISNISPHHKKIKFVLN